MTPNQNRKIKLSHRITAFFLLICFTLLNTFSQAYAAPISIDASSGREALPINPKEIINSLKLPEELGSIQEIFVPSSLGSEDSIQNSKLPPHIVADPPSILADKTQNSGNVPFVLYLQDAHANFDSETNIRKLIHHFQKDYGLNLVLLEGGEGKLDSLFFKSFPDEKVKERILNDYLSRGELSGPETASILNDDYDTDYYGIENQRLYNENKQAFLEALSKEKETTPLLDSIESNLLNQSKTLFSPSTQRLQDKRTSFQKNEIDLMEYVKELKDLFEKTTRDSIAAPFKVGARHAVPLQRGALSIEKNTFKTFSRTYPELHKILLSEEKSPLHPPFTKGGRGDFDAAQTQLIQTFKETLLPKLPKDKQIEMNQMIQFHNIGHLSQGMLVKRIEDLSREFNFQFRTPEVLKPAARRARTLESFHVGARHAVPLLFSELESLEARLRETLPQTNEERALLKDFHHLELLKRLSKLELTRKEWKELKQWKQEAGNKMQDAGSRQQVSQQLKTHNSELRTLFSPHFRFYRLASQRDTALFKNLLKFLNRNTRRHPTPDTCLPAGCWAGHLPRAAILVTGGFHSEGITEKLKKEGIPFVLIAPKINSTGDSTHYFRVMKGEASYMEYFKGSLWDALAQDYAVRAVLSRDPSAERRDQRKPLFRGSRHAARGALLKSWRDRIIQNSIAEGRITEAGSYTKYVDALAKTLQGFRPTAGGQAGVRDRVSGVLKPETRNLKPDRQHLIPDTRNLLSDSLNSFISIYFNRIQNLLKQKLDTFSSGLKDLWDAKNVTPESLGGLLNRVNVPSRSNLALSIALIRGNQQKAEQILSPFEPEDQLQVKRTADDLLSRLGAGLLPQFSKGAITNDEGVRAEERLLEPPKGSLVSLLTSTPKSEPRHAEPLKPSVRSEVREEVKKAASSRQSPRKDQIAGELGLPPFAKDPDLAAGRLAEPASVPAGRAEVRPYDTHAPPTGPARRAVGLKLAQKIEFNDSEELAAFLRREEAIKNIHPEHAGGTHFNTFIYPDFDLVEKYPNNAEVVKSVTLAKERLGGLTAGFVMAANGPTGRLFMESMSSLKARLEETAVTGEQEQANQLLEQFFKVNVEIIQRGVVNWDPKIENYGVNENGNVVLLDLGGLRLAEEVLMEPDLEDSDIAFFHLQMRDSVPQPFRSDFNRLAQQYGFEHGGAILKTIEANYKKSVSQLVEWQPAVRIRSEARVERKTAAETETLPMSWNQPALPSLLSRSESLLGWRSFRRSEVRENAYDEWFKEFNAEKPPFLRASPEEIKSGLKPLPLYGGIDLDELNPKTEEDGKQYVYLYRAVGKEIPVDKLGETAHLSAAGYKFVQTGDKAYSRKEAYKPFRTPAHSVIHSLGFDLVESDETLHTTIYPEQLKKIFGGSTRMHVITYRIPVDWIVKRGNRPIVFTEWNAESELAFYYGLPKEFVWKIDPSAVFYRNLKTRPKRFEPGRSEVRNINLAGMIDSLPEDIREVVTGLPVQAQEEIAVIINEHSNQLHQDWSEIGSDLIGEKITGEQRSYSVDSYENNMNAVYFSSNSKEGLFQWKQSGIVLEFEPFRKYAHDVRYRVPPMPNPSDDYQPLDKSVNRQVWRFVDFDRIRPARIWVENRALEQTRQWLKESGLADQGVKAYVLPDEIKDFGLRRDYYYKTVYRNVWPQIMKSHGLLSTSEQDFRHRLAGIISRHADLNLGYLEYIVRMLARTAAFESVRSETRTTVSENPAVLNKEISNLERSIEAKGLGHLPRLGFHHGEPAGHAPTGQVYYFVLDPTLEDYWRREWQEDPLTAKFGLRNRKNPWSLTDVFMTADDFFKHLFGTVIFTADYGSKEGKRPEIYLLADAPSQNFKLTDRAVDKRGATVQIYDPEKGMTDFPFFFVEGDRDFREIPAAAVIAKIGLEASESNQAVAWAESQAVTGDQNEKLFLTQFFNARLRYKKVLEHVLNVLEKTAKTSLEPQIDKSTQLPRSELRGKEESAGRRMQEAGKTPELDRFTLRQQAEQIGHMLGGRILDNLGLVEKSPNERARSETFLSAALMKLYETGLSSQEAVGLIKSEIEKQVNKALKEKRETLSNPNVLSEAADRLMESLTNRETVQPPPLSLPGLTGQSRLLDSPISAGGRIRPTLFGGESGNDKRGKVSERLPGQDAEAISPRQIWEAFIEAAELPLIEAPVGNEMNWWLAAVRDTIRFSGRIVHGGIEFTSLTESQMNLVRSMVKDLKNLKEDRIFAFTLPLNTIFEQERRNNPSLTKDQFVERFNNETAPSFGEMLAYFAALSDRLKIRPRFPKEWQAVEDVIAKSYGKLITNKDGIKPDQFSVEELFEHIDAVLSEHVGQTKTDILIHASLNSKGKPIDFTRDGLDKLRALFGAGVSVLLSKKTIEGLQRMNDQEFRISDFTIFLAFINAAAAEARAELRIARAA